MYNQFSLVSLIKQKWTCSCNALYWTNGNTVKKVEFNFSGWLCYCPVFVSFSKLHRKVPFCLLYLFTFSAYTFSKRNVTGPSSPSCPPALVRMTWMSTWHSQPSQESSKTAERPHTAYRRSRSLAAGSTTNVFFSAFISWLQHCVCVRKP